MDQRFYDAVAASPVIAAVKDQAGLTRCLAEENIRVVFLLFGDICSIADLVAQVKAAQKIVIVHVDLVTGLSASREIAVDFIRTATQADGIISTRPNFIQRAKELHMYTILRVFVIDSMALSSLENLEKVRPDFLEVLPGVMPKTIRQICKRVHTPVLTGGLIADKEDVMNALNAGAMAISTTNPAVWCL